MKKLMTTILGLFLILSINAQWYQSYGVTNINELNQAQLNLAMEKSVKTIKIGQTMTLIGSGSAIIGYFIYAASVTKIITDDYDNIDENVNKSLVGSTIMYGGALTASIGIPLWISGAMRKTDIEIALKKFDIEETTALGFGIRINF